MTLATTADLVADAVARGTAVAAFNAITLEHAEGIAEGLERAGVAGIIQLSENAVRFHGGRLAPVARACAAVAAPASVGIALHLDHLKDITLIDEAITTAESLGVSSLMVDAAHLSYGDNVAQTHTVVQRAHAAGLWAEAEIGEVGGKDGRVLGAHEPGARTDPDEAAAFVERTGVDGLAVAVGSSHAMTTRDALLDVELIDRLAAQVPVPLVLHGSSGVPDSQLQHAVAVGIRKVNIGTALNLAYTGAVRTALAGDTAVTDPRAYLVEARRAVADTVAELCGVLAADRTVGAGEGDSR